MTYIGRSFGKADHGVRWALDQLPRTGDGRLLTALRLRLLPLEGAAGDDDYAIEWSPLEVSVRANTAVGAIGGILRLGQLMRDEEGMQDIVQPLRFRTRNYKHEIHFDPASPRSILKYTDATWEALCRQIVSHQFNGLVLYTPEHPFEYFLDYSSFPESASKPEADRTAIREALNRGMNIAQKYGLKTFIQHYIGHFTQQLADAYKIPTTGRLSNVDHPAVDRYCSWCYRETFRQLPSLDGLYFNYESMPTAHLHILKTAIKVFNKMKRPPIMVHRLWSYTDMEGIRQMMQAYKGRTIVSHKGHDTNDTYYLPVADSRVMEWKKVLGEKLEFMFCTGPCHNCGTNLQNQLWGDYEYVQQWFADAQAKGADSISFHTVNEFFSPDLSDPKGAFGDHEKNLARFNRMHLQAAVDYYNGVARTPAQRAEVMARRAEVPAKAGKALLAAVEASSQLVLLGFQQFCYGSAFEGYLNYGRWSHIQEPFLFYPATGLNDQASSLMWATGWSASPWVDKTIDTKVAPDDLLQYIIDYVDPSKPKAKRHPAKIADLLARKIERSFAEAKTFRKLSGNKKLADALQAYLEQNAATGGYFEFQIRAAIRLYSIYFAKSKAAIVSALEDGLAHLKAALPIVADRSSPTYRVMHRVTMLDRLDPTVEIQSIEQMLRALESTDFPMAAYATYLESRRLYNETRRVMRPYRRHNETTLKFARQQLQASIAKARTTLVALGQPALAAASAEALPTTPLAAGAHRALAENVFDWLVFVENELARTSVPAAVCPKKRSDEWISLQHDDSFRGGDNFVEDFLGFFQKFDYLRPCGMAFRVWNTGRELAVSLREQGVDYRARRARWDEHMTGGSSSFVHQIHVDTENQGRQDLTFIVWPTGSSVTFGRTPYAPVRTEFAHDAVSWQVTAYFPFKLLGRKPKPGETWRLNISANPAVRRNFAYTWAPQYDAAGNPVLYGRVTFE